VWICSYPNGHIQAVGTDAAGRLQYLYPRRAEDRNEEKVSTGCWRCRPRCPTCDGASRRPSPRGLERDRVLALALHLLDLATSGWQRAIREENNSFGIATLLCEPCRLQKQAVEFDYPRKEWGASHSVDRRGGGSPVRAGTAAPPRPHRTTPGVAATVPVGSTFSRTINARFKELVGDEYTVKDLRTWHGTVMGAAAFVAAALL